MKARKGVILFNKNIKYDKPVFVFILYYILINVKLKTLERKLSTGIHNIYVYYLLSMYTFKSIKV